MRVLYVHSGNLFGGVETLMLTLVRQQHLCPDMDPHFALCFEGKFSEELSVLGPPVYSLGSVRVSRPLTILRARRNLKDLLQREHFDLVVLHSAWVQGVFGPTIRSANLPLVFWVHDIPDSLAWPERWGRRTQPDLAICDSRFTADRLPRLYPECHYRIIHCPIAPTSVTVSNDERNSVRAEFDTSKEAVVILQISRLERHKGQLLHLEALGMLRDVPNWICWQLVGVQRSEEQRYFEQLEETAMRLGIENRVRFIGWQPEVQKLIAASDIYCQPNIEPEAFGITFIEALYAGKPAVATALGGPKELVDDSCGFLIAPNDATLLAQTLRMLIEDRQLRLKLGSAGPLRARKLCDPATQMRELREAFLEVSRNGLN